MRFPRSPRSKRQGRRCRERRTTRPPPYMRVVDSRAILGTLRFDDHRGIKPEDVSFVGGSMTALLTRSKTLGSDRAVYSRRVHINSCCFLKKREWLEGWRVLRTSADYERDYLLPAPSTNCNGCLRGELRYKSAFAMQNRVFAIAPKRRKFRGCLPRSGPRTDKRFKSESSQTQVLGDNPKEVRDHA